LKVGDELVSIGGVPVFRYSTSKNKQSFYGGRR